MPSSYESSGAQEPALDLLRSHLGSESSSVDERRAVRIHAEALRSFRALARTRRATLR